MENDITFRDVSPKRTLTHHEICTFDGLERVVYSIYDEAKSNMDGSFFLTTNLPYLKQDCEIQVYCPIANGAFPIDYDKFQYTVVQRSRVISIIHSGQYDKLEPSFDALLQYAKENNIKVKAPYRVVFHTEKRKWQRKRFFKRTVSSYITEVQIEIDEDS